MGTVLVFSDFGQKFLHRKLSFFISISSRKKQRIEFVWKYMQWRRRFLTVDWSRELWKLFRQIFPVSEDLCLYTKCDCVYLVDWTYYNVMRLKSNKINILSLIVNKLGFLLEQTSKISIVQDPWRDKTTKYLTKTLLDLIRILKIILHWQKKNTETNFYS